ncbi:MAG: heparinase II/III family protein, partial [Burkholderiales bacterium]|nr:heparinase II/III family protein [Opitutaceae bacterium]
FGRGRYDIWTMQSDYHNVPQINGVAQVKGRAFQAKGSKFDATDGVVSFSTDIAKAYPPEAKVASWRRGYTLERGKRFVVEDRFELTANQGKTAVHFMTSLPAEVVRPGVIALKGEGFVLHLAYDPGLLSARIEEREIDDPKLARNVGPKVSRLVLAPAARDLTGTFRFEVTLAK